MVSRSTIAVSLVVVALLAGCSGLVGDGAGGPDSPDEFDYAAGFSADGVTDDQAAIRSYREALTNKSSFTVAYQQNVTGPDTDLSYDVAYRVDVEGEQAHHRVEVPSQDYLREDYYADGEQASRVVDGGDEQVASGDSQFSAEQLTGGNAISRLLSNDTDYETSVAERGGTSVVVYETSGAENAASVFDLEQGNVSSFTASFAVDSEGVVRTASYELVYVGQNGAEQTVTLDFEVTAIDETSVERPEWANES